MNHQENQSDPALGLQILNILSSKEYEIIHFDPKPIIGLGSKHGIAGSTKRDEWINLHKDSSKKE